MSDHAYFLFPTADDSNSFSNVSQKKVYDRVYGAIGPFPDDLPENPPSPPAQQFSNLLGKRPAELAIIEHPAKRIATTTTDGCGSPAQHDRQQPLVSSPAATLADAGSSSADSPTSVTPTKPGPIVISDDLSNSLTLEQTFRKFHDSFLSDIERDRKVYAQRVS